MENLTVILGIDVGGTNTDAVVLEKSTGTAKVLASVKTTTTGDITSGVRKAIRLVLLKLEDRVSEVDIQQVNIGTTHFVNAVVQGKNLAKVSVIRLCGTASKRVPPFSDFTDGLAEKIKGSIFMASGGCQFDGQEISSVVEAEIISYLNLLKDRDEKNIVVAGIFSPVRQDQEIYVVELIAKHYPEASVTASHLIGKLGLLERENAAILNECFKPLCLEVIKGFRKSLQDLGINCPLYLTQNDGTVISEETALQFPVHTFASGPTNSMRGAAFLSGLENAFVIDVGGTSTDTGVLMKGFPRHASSEVKVGGIRTNFQMPDVISIGLGGGSYVTERKNKVSVGPLSAGYRLTEEAYVFADRGDLSNRHVTAFDIAIAAGLANVGNSENLTSLSSEFIEKVVYRVHEMISKSLDQMRFSNEEMPLILVGGGSIIVDEKKQFEGVSEIIKPDYYDVANAIGAALSQVSATVDRTVDLEKYSDVHEMLPPEELKQANIEPGEKVNFSSLSDNIRRVLLTKARDKALEQIIQDCKQDVLKSGGKADTIKLVDKEDIAINYIPGNATRILVKVVAELQPVSQKTNTVKLDSVRNKMLSEGETGIKEKQVVTATGTLLQEEEGGETELPVPTINEETGEWVLSPFDIECLYIGTGILATGGGGNPHIGKLSALRALKDGKRIRVVTPSRFYKTADMEKDVVVNVAFMGAPLVIYEKLMSGNESRGALESMQDMYNEREYSDGKAMNDIGIKVEKANGATFVENYELTKKQDNFRLGDKRIAAVMGMEIGGLNSTEPLVVAAELDLPVLDCDMMGRAFPELQMVTPFMYGCPAYPCVVADDKGRKAVLLHCENPKQMEDCFRRICVTMGCTAGIVLSYLNGHLVQKNSVLHSLSYAWRIGNTILRARIENKSAVDAMIECTNGKLLIDGKLTDVKREITGGFNRGRVIVDGMDAFENQKVVIDFQNEFLIARYMKNDNPGEVLACVPDLITVVDIDTAQPIPTEEIHYGMRVSVVVMPVSPIMATEQALKWVGPQAFGYPKDIIYKPVSEFPNYEPVGPK